jgi:hypothetical protein
MQELDFALKLPLPPGEREEKRKEGIDDAFNTRVQAYRKKGDIHSLR